MNKQNKTLLGAAFFTAVLFFASVIPLKAAVRCETQYGGGETCVRTGELQIDKEVCKAKTDSSGRFLECDLDHDEFIDNFNIDDPRFATNQEIVFKLKIKNVGDDTLFNIDVTDTLPDYLFFSGGSTGEFTIDKLNPGEEFVKFIRTRVVAESMLPAEKSLICMVNTAEAEADNGEHDKDTAQICIGKKVLGITTLPKTGSSDLGTALLVSTISGLFGLGLIKFAKVN